MCAASWSPSLASNSIWSTIASTTLIFMFSPLGGSSCSCGSPTTRSVLQIPFVPAYAHVPEKAPPRFGHSATKKGPSGPSFWLHSGDGNSEQLRPSFRHLEHFQHDAVYIMKLDGLTSLGCLRA